MSWLKSLFDTDIMVNKQLVVMKDEQMKKKVTWGLMALCVVLAALGSRGTTEKPSTETIVSELETTENVQANNIENNENSELEIHFIDVGQGDATLVMCDGEAMLIDAGDNDKGSQVQLYLSKRNIKQLKYVIGTHPDSDHIGGLDVVLYKFDCETIIMPDISADTATYRDVLEVMNEKKLTNSIPNVGDYYTLGSANFTIVGPIDTYEGRNNNSVSILLEHGENTFLFTGDAEEVAELDIVSLDMDIDADVYHVGHHGSSSSSTLELLQEVTPAFAVISCGEGNSYGHPHAETLNNLRAMGVSVFRTDEQGSITVTSDGKTLTWNCAPSDTWQAGER